MRVFPSCFRQHFAKSCCSFYEGKFEGYVSGLKNFGCWEFGCVSCVVIRGWVEVDVIIIESPSYFGLWNDDLVGWLVDAGADVVGFG